MRCPSCSAETPDGSAECHACGVNFAKWQAKVERQTAEAPPPSPPPSKRGGGLYALLALVVAAAAAAGGFALYERSLEPPAADDGKPIYDPAPYRAQIYALEKTLYAQDAPTAADANALANLSLQIAGQLQEDHAQNPYVHKAVNDLVLFAGQVSPDSSQGKPTAKARQDWVAAWETLRAKRFARARWFHPPSGKPQQ